MMYGSWDIKCNRQICHFRLPFDLLPCTKNHDHMLCCSWDMKPDTCNIYLSFWTIFAPNSPKNQNFKKMNKNLESSSFYTYVPKIMIRWCMVPEIWYAKDGWTDGQIDAWTEKVTYRGGSPPRKTVLVLKISYDLLNLSLLFHLTFSLTFRIEYLKKCFCNKRMQNIYILVFTCFAILSYCSCYIDWNSPTLIFLIYESAIT